MRTTLDLNRMFETADEMMVRYESERAARLKIGRWGAWRLCGRRKWLGINRVRPNRLARLYEFELAAQSPLKWICHLRDKTWMQRGDLEDLLAAFNDIYGYSWLANEIYGQKRSKHHEAKPPACPHYPSRNSGRLLDL